MYEFWHFEFLFLLTFWNDLDELWKFPVLLIFWNDVIFLKRWVYLVLDLDVTWGCVHSKYYFISLVGRKRYGKLKIKKETLICLILKQGYWSTFSFAYIFEKWMNFSTLSFYCCLQFEMILFLSRDNICI